jgi:hypothetical protein
VWRPLRVLPIRTISVESVYRRLSQETMVSDTYFVPWSLSNIALGSSASVLLNKGSPNQGSPYRTDRSNRRPSVSVYRAVQSHKFKKSKWNTYTIGSERYTGRHERYTDRYEWYTGQLEWLSSVIDYFTGAFFRTSPVLNKFKFWYDLCTYNTKRPHQSIGLIVHTNTSHKLIIVHTNLVHIEIP